MNILCSKNYYKEGDKLYPQFDSTEAYQWRSHVITVLSSDSTGFLQIK
jgi:hypothetical protein